MKSAIKFNGEMLAAVIGGRKTQTRRIISPQPADCSDTQSVIKAFPYKLKNGVIPFSDINGCERGTLKITSVKIKRIRDISNIDAVNEGFNGLTPSYDFMQEWIKIYGESNWVSNPFVWVIKFKVEK